MIKRFVMCDGVNREAYAEEDEKGGYVLFKDYLKVVEELEYDLRYYMEDVEYKDETIQELIDEVNHWKDLYNELYEQTS